MTQNRPSTHNDQESKRVALEDLLEVETALRDKLQSSADPTVSERLRNLHREIERYIAEITPKK